MRNRRGMRLGERRPGPPPAWIWEVKGSPSPAQLQPRSTPPAGSPGAAGLTAFSCSSRSFILVPERPEAGERVPGERVPGERPEVATRPGRGRGSSRRRREAAAGEEERPRPREAPPRRPLRPRRRRALQIRLPGRRRRAALILPPTRPSPGPRPRSSLKGPCPAAACPLGVSRSTCSSCRTTQGPEKPAERAGLWPLTPQGRGRASGSV